MSSEALRLKVPPSCPLYGCEGTLLATPTQGRWQCSHCRATLLVGQQVAVLHQPGATAEEVRA